MTDSFTPDLEERINLLKKEFNERNAEAIAKWIVPSDEEAKKECEPCPLCGGRNLIVQPSSFAEESTIECEDCNLLLGLNTRAPWADVVKLWNTRHFNTPEKKEEIND